MVPKLSPVDREHPARFFEAHGFKRDRQKGSHLSLTKPGTLRPVVIPMHSKDVAVGVIQSNLRTAGLPRDALMDWLGKK